MSASIRRALLLFASLFALITALTPGGGGAQYPTPIGSITPTGPTTVEAESVIQIACTLLDTNGDAVPNQPVIFRIDENPGTANLLNASPLTDADGNGFADLYVGNTPGQVTVSCELGDIAAQYTVQVLPQPSFASTVPPALPPAQDVAGISIKPLTNFLSGIPGLSGISTDLAVIMTNLLLALLALTTLLVAATVFNATVEGNSAEMTGMLKAFPRRVGPLAGVAGLIATGGPRISGLPARIMPFFVLALTATIYATLDPNFGWNNQTLVLVLALVAGLAMVTFLYEGGQVLWSSRRYKTPGSVKMFPIAIAISIICVVLAKLTNMHPGVVFGFAMAAAIAPNAILGKRERGLIVAVPLLGLLLVSILAFLLIDPLRDFGRDHPGTWGMLPETIAVAVFVGGAQSTLLVLIPLRFNDGEDVWQWNKLIWLALAVPATFAFIHVMLNDEDIAELAKQNDSLTLLALCVGALLLSVAVWGYFRLREKRRARAVAP